MQKNLLVFERSALLLGFFIFICPNYSVSQEPLPEFNLDITNIPAVEVPESDRLAPSAEQETTVCGEDPLRCQAEVSWSKYFDDLFRNIQKPRALAQNLFFAQSDNVGGQFKLSALLNAYMKTSITFKTAAGDTVYVSGTKAFNCAGGGRCVAMNKYFLVFYTSRGQTIFIKGNKIVNVSIFKKGEKDIYFDGDKEKYTVRIRVKVTNPKKSRLQIKNRSRLVIDVTFEELMKAIFETGQDFKLRRRYIMTYANEIYQDAKGDAYMGEKKVFVFMIKGNEKDYYLVPESEITLSGVTFPRMGINYVFRIIDGFLGIFLLQ